MRFHISFKVLQKDFFHVITLVLAQRQMLSFDNFLKSYHQNKCYQPTRQIYIQNVGCSNSSQCINSEVSPNFLVWKLCGRAQFLQSLRCIARTLRKLCLSTKFPYQEIGEYSVFYAVSKIKSTLKFLKHASALIVMLC